MNSSVSPQACCVPPDLFNTTFRVVTGQASAMQCVTLDIQAIRHLDSLDAVKYSQQLTVM